MVYYITGALVCSTLYFVCCVAAPGSDAAAGYKDWDGYTESNIVYPRRVTRRGDFVSHFLSNTYKRHRRNKDFRRSLDGELHYLVPLRGKDYHLQLSPNHLLISPGMVIENHRKVLSERSISHANNTQCHYTGFVRGDKDSKVAISTCNGLTGYVRTKRHYFFIEPMPGHLPSSTRAHPHIVNMHSIDDNFDINCETSGDIAEVIAKRSLRYQRGSLNKCVAELHIETLVVIDHSMLTYHKGIDVENYVLTVFNMAHDMYHDASLGTNINLAIVRLIRLEQEDHEMNIAVNRDATKTLEYFREWQNKINPKEDTHPNHHDVAVLLTRIDICGNDNSCGLLGASKIGGMCDPHNQAAVCEDNGLRLGFVIAHEIAHTLAILHDTMEDSGCNSTIPGFGKCMYDTPTEHSFKPVDILPGVMYDGNFQCRELLGPNAALCMTGLECENLICYIEDKGCVETHTGVAPGTSCGENMWCYRGECVEIGERETATDGGWGPWSDWSECSRTCGSGVAFKERHCDTPRPKNGGKYCEGDHMRHKICASEPCDASQPSFRDVQCAEFNSWVYPEDEKIHTWKNYPMPDENPCVLFCINDYGDIASLRPRVTDGTACQRGDRDVCINGLCKKIPCDLDLESNAVEDACGVCRGDSTSCDLKMGEIQVPCCGHITEQEVMVLPVKSINIKIEEMMPSESRIQIRNCEGETVYVIGNVFGTFNVPGSLAWMGNIRPKQESVRIPGPISDGISIWLVVVENVTIRYSYGVPAEKRRKPSFYWDFLRWERCSAECGPGIEESLPSCVEKIGGEVDEKYCKKLPKPNVQIRACELAPCVTRWFVGDWQPCSKCPRGKRQRVVKCVRPTGQGEGEVTFISDSQCVGPKPKSKEACTCPVTRAPPIKRDVSVDSTGHVIVSAPVGAKAHTREDIQVDANGNVLKAREKVQASSSTDNSQSTAKTYYTNAKQSNVLHSTGKGHNTTEAYGHFTTGYNTTVSPTTQNNSLSAEECKNASLANQYLGIKTNLSAPHCPTNLEYDEDLYCNETQNYEDMFNNNTNRTMPHVNLTTCIILSVAEMENVTENVTLSYQEEYTTEPMDLYANETLTNGSSTISTFSILTANRSDETCSKLAKLIGQTALDKENYDNLSLTIHTELEHGQRPIGLPPPANAQEADKQSFEVHGKEAMEFINSMQKDYDNNKTKI